MSTLISTSSLTATLNSDLAGEFTFVPTTSDSTDAAVGTSSAYATFSPGDLQTTTNGWVPYTGGMVDSGSHLYGGSTSYQPSQPSQMFNIGTPLRPWGALYAELGVVTTSDRTAKSFISDSSLGLGFLMSLRPVSYTFKGRPASAVSYGFIGQEVESALKGRPFDGLQVSDGMYSLRYTDFIAPIVKAVQQQEQTIRSLQAQLIEMSIEIARLKQQ